MNWRQRVFSMPVREAAAKCNASVEEIRGCLEELKRLEPTQGFLR